MNNGDNRARTFASCIAKALAKPEFHRMAFDWLLDAAIEAGRIDLRCAPKLQISVGSFSQTIALDNCTNRLAVFASAMSTFCWNADNVVLQKSQRGMSAIVSRNDEEIVVANFDNRSDTPSLTVERLVDRVAFLNDV